MKPQGSVKAQPLGRFRPFVTNGHEHVRHLCTRCGIRVGNPSRKSSQQLCQDCVGIELTISHICQVCHETEVHYKHRRKGITVCPDCQEKQNMTITQDWWQTYSNVVLLVRYLAEQGDDALDIVYAMEKPWKYTEEFRKAVKWNADQAGD